MISAVEKINSRDTSCVYILAHHIMAMCANTGCPIE